jgi:hypothetical protein
MLSLYPKSLLTVILLLMVPASDSMVHGEQPAQISPLMLPGTVGECPSDGDRLAALDVLHNATHEIIKNLLDGSEPFEICGPGDWTRVFYFNASTLDQSCPGEWNLITSPIKACAGAGGSCRSAFSESINTPYSRVCGRVIGGATGSPDAFDVHDFANENDLEAVYLDGMSVTFGAAGSRRHIWTFGAGFIGRCPCDISTGWPYEPPGPPEVGNSYFCGRSSSDSFVPLWTGESCTGGNPCCSFNNPPYFSVQLPSTATERIELRICHDETNEEVLALFAEIYVQ